MGSTCTAARSSPTRTSSRRRRNLHQRVPAAARRAAGEVSQDFHVFLERYRAQHADDVLVVEDEVSPDQEVTALVWALAAQGREPLLVFERVKGTKVVTNIFASRARIARLLGTVPEKLHQTYQEKSRQAVDPEVVSRGPVLDSVEEKVD